MHAAPALTKLCQGSRGIVKHTLMMGKYIGENRAGINKHLVFLFVQLSLVADNVSVAARSYILLLTYCLASIFFLSDAC